MRGKVGVYVLERHEMHHAEICYLVCHRLITGDLSEIIATDGGEGYVETEKLREYVIRERQDTSDLLPCIRHTLLKTVYLK